MDTMRWLWQNENTTKMMSCVHEQQKHHDLARFKCLKGTMDAKHESDTLDCRQRAKPQTTNYMEDMSKNNQPNKKCH